MRDRMKDGFLNNILFDVFVVSEIHTRGVHLVHVEFPTKLGEIAIEIHRKPFLDSAKNPVNELLKDSSSEFSSGF